MPQEKSISDLIQFLSDRDPTPWAELVGFVPDDVAREAQYANHADLLLTAESKAAVVEVKLGHLMSAKQKADYEALRSRPDLYLAALSSDGARLESDSDRWSFLGLNELIGRWEEVDDELARLLASEAAGVLRKWDQMISGVFDLPTADESMPLRVLDQKFLARVVTRRIAQDYVSEDDWRQQASRAEVACLSSRAGHRCGGRGTTARSWRRFDGGSRSREANCGSASTSTPGQTRTRTKQCAEPRTSWRAAWTPTSSTPA